MAMVRKVEVADILATRDARAELQQDMLKKWNMPLISFTMNIAGDIKHDFWIEKAFNEGVRRIEIQLKGRKITAKDIHEKISFTGCERLWVVDVEAEKAKEWMVAIEESDALGRLFDIDVIDIAGEKLVRPGMGRKCLICGKSAAICGRSRAHTGEELFQKAHQIIEAHFLDQSAAEIGKYAERALLYEAITTPKPGLVDRMDNGAHRDMDLFSFTDSACELRTYFERCFRIGAMFRDNPPETIFERLRSAGIEAEERMLSITDGVNTHKGALFSLGILCGAAGMGEGESFSQDRLFRRAGVLAQTSLKDFEGITMESAATGGERQYLSMGAMGARGEAAEGFPTLRDVALPAFETAIENGKSLNDAGLFALMALISSVSDSNIIRRTGMKRQILVMEEAKNLIQQGITYSALEKMNERFICDNISPGGSADLLAATYFIYFLKRGIN